MYDETGALHGFFMCDSREFSRMSTYSIYLRSIVWMRFFLLFTSLCSIAVLVLWFKYPAQIDALDEMLLERYMEPYQQRLDKAKKARKDKEPKLAIFYLEKLREELSTVLKGDRLDPVKRVVLKELADIYHTTLQHESAFAVLDEWITFDSRDLNVQILRASWQGAEGKKTMQMLYERYPYLKKRATPKSHTKTIGSDRDEMIYAADTLGLPPTGKWQLFWDDGDGFREAASKRATPVMDKEAAHVFGVSVPGNVHRLRIDGPSQPILVTNLSIRMEGNGSSVTLPLIDVKPRRQVHKVGPDTLEMTGKDPQIRVLLPKSLWGIEPLHIQVRGWMMKAPSSRIVELLTSRKSKALLNDIEKKGDISRARFLRQLQEKYYRGSAKHESSTKQERQK